MPKNAKTLLTLAGALAVMAAASAQADAPVPVGDPVPAGPVGDAAQPDRGLGVALPDSVRLTELRVADPGGGPPWGLRALKTTRGMGCAQVGRVQDEQIGLLGRDGAFADDGLFHPLPAELLRSTSCTQLDAAGHAFLSISYQGLPASGSDTGCRAPSSLPAPAGAGAPAGAPPACPAEDERIVYYGLLGPQGRSVTYKGDDGRPATSAADGPEGAYLVVVRPNAQRPAKGYFVPSTSPVSGLISVAYKNGKVCTLRSPRSFGGGKHCPLVGFQGSKEPRVTHAQIAAPVRVRVAKATHEVQPPRAIPHAHAGSERTVTISFRARRASPDARSYYVITLKADNGSGCHFGMLLSPVARTVKAGTIVHEQRSIPGTCRGRVSGTVAFHQQGDEPDAIPFGPISGKDPLVGRFAARIPG
jgi:hypothetical protein